jgi:multisubunit Na+/H+ antiporter MnhB subunit
MGTSALIGLVFLAIAGIFFVIALRDSVRSNGRVARRVRFRLGIIYAIVGIGLQFVHRCFGH